MASSPKNLVIVESPAKSATIKKYLGDDFEVKASYGHISDLPKKKMGIDIKNNFTPTYEVSEDKKKVISELKSRVKKVDKVWLATDEDREGEAIAWHVANTLGLDVKKTSRIVFHEITKPAIEKAIKEPRFLDMDLVDAQQARRVLDRLVWFELSPVLRQKVKGGLSAGRVQSVAVRLIVDKEREIQKFASAGSYKVVGTFEYKKVAFTAEANKKINKIDEAKAFLEEASKSDFTVKKVETKPGKRSPSAPFTTSTIQQEASRKLGFPVARTMSVAQKLYEAWLITYMRTDSVNISDTALKAAQDAITKMYGKEYHQSRKFKGKSANAQEAHECIRPTDMMKPSAGADAAQKKLYELIWKRTIACQMADANVEKTTLTIDVSESKIDMVAQAEIIKFDGFIKVYSESSDEEGDEETVATLPKIDQGDSVNMKQIIGTEKYSRHPARYTEASLVKKLEEEWIGRPSTYAPTISTVQQRWYVEKKDLEGIEKEYTILTLKNSKITQETKKLMYGADKNKLFPTDIGIVVTDFLIKNFPKILDHKFTANVEEDFDEIATGKLWWTKMIKAFYDPFHKTVEQTATTARESGEKILGTDPKTGKAVIVRIGRYGPMAQLGKPDDEEKPKYASIKGKSIDTITLEEALEYFRLPRNLGDHKGEDLVAGLGKFGPYIKRWTIYASLDKEAGDDIFTIDKKRATALIEARKELVANANIHEREHEGKPLQVLKGRYGPYIKYDKKNYKIPKTVKPEELTLKETIKLLKK